MNQTVAERQVCILFVQTKLRALQIPTLREASRPSQCTQVTNTNIQIQNNFTFTLFTWPIRVQSKPQYQTLSQTITYHQPYIKINKVWFRRLHVTRFRFMIHLFYFPFLRRSQYLSFHTLYTYINHHIRICNLNNIHCNTQLCVQFRLQLLVQEEYNIIAFQLLTTSGWRYIIALNV